MSSSPLARFIDEGIRIRSGLLRTAAGIIHRSHSVDIGGDLLHLERPAWEICERLPSHVETPGSVVEAVPNLVTHRVSG